MINFLLRLTFILVTGISVYFGFFWLDKVGTVTSSITTEIIKNQETKKVSEKYSFKYIDKNGYEWDGEYIVDLPHSRDSKRIVKSLLKDKVYFIRPKAASSPFIRITQDNAVLCLTLFAAWIIAYLLTCLDEGGWQADCEINPFYFTILLLKWLLNKRVIVFNKIKKFFGYDIINH